MTKRTYAIKKWAVIVPAVILAALFLAPVNTFAEELSETEYFEEDETDLDAIERIVSEGSDKIVVVIDPGHGGSNIGAQNDMWIEKDMTLITALSIKEELSKFEGIEVYLTRTEDVEMSLNERADFAKSVGADFLFSVHYNDSENKNLYGTEIWVQNTDPYYSKGYAYGKLFLKQTTSIGLFERGIKTRVNDDDDEWYGILRGCKRNEITAVLMEHCHVSSKDEPYVDSVEKLKEFGRMDALSIAEFYGLKNDEYDFSDRTLCYPSPAIDIVRNDTSNPGYAEVVPVKTTEELLTVNLKAFDAETGIKYYSVSVDNGKTYGELYTWEVDAGAMGAQFVNIERIDDCSMKVKFRIYDGYDNIRETNTVIYPYYKAAEEPYVYDSTEYIEEALPRLYEQFHKVTVIDIIHNIENNISEISLLIFSIVAIFITILCWIFILTMRRKKVKRVAEPYYDEIG